MLSSLARHHHDRTVNVLVARPDTTPEPYRTTHVIRRSLPIFRFSSPSDVSHPLILWSSLQIMYLTPKGRNWGDLVNWDDLGKLFAAVICFWTVLLVSGAVWLICNRNLPFIKIRNVPLAILSTLFLHIYLVKICLAYTTNGHFLCSAEYWIMSIYLPFGIALFQAYLIQLRSIWEQQQRLIHNDPGGRQDEDVSKTNLIQRWKGLSRLRQSYCLIAVGMLTQVRLSEISEQLRSELTPYS